MFSGISRVSSPSSYGISGCAHCGESQKIIECACKVISYCSIDCQTYHKESHEEFCKLLRASKKATKRAKKKAAKKEMQKKPSLPESREFTAQIPKNLVDFMVKTNNIEREAQQLRESVVKDVILQKIQELEGHPIKFNDDLQRKCDESNLKRAQSGLMRQLANYQLLGIIEKNIKPSNPEEKGEDNS